MRYAAVRDAADPDLSVYMNRHRVCVSLRKSTVALPLTMYRPRPLQRCSTTLLLLLTSLTWGLLCVWLGAWRRELDPPRLVSPFRIGTPLVVSCPSRTGDTDRSGAPGTMLLMHSPARLVCLANMLAFKLQYSTSDTTTACC